MSLKVQYISKECYKKWQAFKEDKEFSVKYRLKLFENRVLRKLFEHKREDLTVG
jgi:hypothetical protein